MFSVSDFRVCISSFEFSVIFDSCRNCCPACGTQFDDASYIRISSLLILVGFGSFLCYKFILGKRRQRTSPLGQENILGNSVPRVEALKNESVESSPVQRPHITSKWTSTPAAAKTWTPADRRHSLGSEPSEHEQDTASFLRTLSIGSTNESIFGDQTVAKLDVLLNQIEDIKKSVGEMDVELMTARKKGRLMRLTLADDLSEANETSPPSPTLEWDSNDINDVTFYVEDQPISEESDIIPVADRSKLHLNLDLELDGVVKLTDSPNSSSSSSSSSSGKGSLTSSPDEKREKEKRVQDILSQARRLGVISDLRDALLEPAKRDSAFFET